MRKSGEDGHTSGETPARTGGPCQLTRTCVTVAVDVHSQRSIIDIIMGIYTAVSTGGRGHQTTVRESAATWKILFSGHRSKRPLTRASIPPVAYLRPTDAVIQLIFVLSSSAWTISVTIQSPLLPLLLPSNYPAQQKKTSIPAIYISDYLKKTNKKSWIFICNERQQFTQYVTDFQAED